MKVTWIDDQWRRRGDYSKGTGSITIHVLKENKRPIGFAREWPEEQEEEQTPKEQKPKKKHKRKKPA